MEDKITLTLEPDKQEEVQPVEEEKTVEPVELTERDLTPEEQAMVEEFADKIDLTNSNMILQYGAAAQTKISEFSEGALGKVRSRDLGEIGDSLTNLVTELKGFDIENTYYEEKY